MYMQDLKIKALSLPYVGNKKAVLVEKKRLKMMAQSYALCVTILAYFRLKREEHTVDKLLALQAMLDKEEADLF